MASRLLQRARRAWFVVSQRSKRIPLDVVARYHALPSVRARFYDRTGYYSPFEAHVRLYPEKRALVLRARDASFTSNLRASRRYLPILEKQVINDPEFPLRRIHELFELQQEIENCIHSRIGARDLLNQYDEIVHHLRETFVPRQGFAPGSPYELLGKLSSPLEQMRHIAQEGAAEMALRELGIGTIREKDIRMSNRVMDILEEHFLQVDVEQLIRTRKLSKPARRLLIRVLSPILGGIRTRLFLHHFAQNYAGLFLFV